MKITNRKITPLATGFAITTLFAISGMTPAFADGTLFVVGDQVGINVETPMTGAKLHVKAATGGGGVDSIFLENTIGPSRIKLVNGAITNDAVKNKEWILNSNGSFRISRPGGGTQMKLDAGGFMTVTGGYAVGGTALDVPDYVFEPDYELRSLSEVQDFIDHNGHLPDVPSAETVRADGLNMTDMQMLLLQKVEELTLYTIQQQKTIEDLQSQIAQIPN